MDGPAYNATRVRSASVEVADRPQVATHQLFRARFPFSAPQASGAIFALNHGANTRCTRVKPARLRYKVGRYGGSLVRPKVSARKWSRNAGDMGASCSFTL